MTTMDRRTALVPLLAMAAGCSVSHPGAVPISPLGATTDGDTAALSRDRWVVVSGLSDDVSLHVWGPWDTLEAAEGWAKTNQPPGGWVLAGLTAPRGR